jgi:hypothetical protein
MFQTRAEKLRAAMEPASRPRGDGFIHNLVEHGQTAGDDQGHKQDGKLADFSPVHLAVAEGMEELVAPPEDKEHSEKSQRSVEELADCPAMEAKRAMQKKEGEDQGHVAEERYEYGEEELLFSLKKPGEHTGEDGEQARYEEIAG